MLLGDMERLTAAGTVYRNDQPGFGSMAVAMQKGTARINYRLETEHQAVNMNIDEASMLMPNLDE